MIASDAGVTVGDDCVLGAFSCVGVTDPTVPGADRPAAVTIGDRARVGAHAVVLAGATVGAGAVVGAYAVVAGEIRAGTSVTGVGQTVAPRSSA